MSIHENNFSPMIGVVSQKFCPPRPSKNILSDISSFLIHKAHIPTLIKFKSEEERENFSKRILQRLSADVSDYSVLNIHKIGIDAPVQYIFDELKRWNGASTCWPNHLATVERINGRLEEIEIYFMGKKKYPLGLKNGIFGFKFIPLFKIHEIRIRELPDILDVDNARYLLYECSGGYPIGIFAMYVRSPILSENESCLSQLFLVVSFNFYGKKAHGSFKWMNWMWEKIHNRVTANIMNRFKQLCEWNFHRIQSGDSIDFED